MRQTVFLRTPIKAAHQGRMQNLQVSEQPPAGNPAAGDVYPQTLIVSFDVAAGTTDVEIAPLWEGYLYFLPDDTTGYPTKPEEVTPANFDKWRLVGDLVLHNTRGFLDESAAVDQAFASHIKLIRPAASAVRYSKVRLTRDFLFGTLAAIPAVVFVSDGAKVDERDRQWHAKFVLGFLRGRTKVPCPVDAADPSKDFANQAMPSVHLAAPGGATTFRVAVAARAPEAEVTGFAWFQHRPEFDDIPGVPLVPPTLDTLTHQRFNPAHPSHSVISAFALYQSASAAAYAPDHDAAKPLRAALTAPRPDGATYRRIDLIRPPAPGNAVTTSYPQRPFPQYQLSWRPAAGGTTQSLRIPLTGRLYLPLTDQDYRFWASPRSRDPEEGVAQFLLSRKQPSKKYIDLPSTMVTYAPAAGDDPPPLYADLLDYDSKRTWTAFVELDDFQRFKDKAKEAWNVPVLNFFIHRSAAMVHYGRIYGFFRAAAGRHGLAPEFLHAVFMGEGPGAGDDPSTPEEEQLGLIEQNRKNGVPYSDTEVINSFGDLGLDVIGETIGPLIANGYLDSAFSADQVLSNPRSVPNEKGEPRTTWDIAGWEAAIELVAAELHSRLDAMRAYCAANGIAITTDVQRRFLAYLAYNAGVAGAKALLDAENLDKRLRSWTGSWPGTQRNAHFNSLIRVAISEWYENAEVYR
jgi:hypothetical protein